jgi:hypothetical protein
MPQMPVTVSGGRRQPNSDAELAAYRKAMAEFNKETDKYNEAVRAQSRSQSRGNNLKRSHRDLTGGNGTGNGNFDNSANYVNHDQNRGCARSQGQGQGAPQLPSSNEVNQGQYQAPLAMQTVLGEEFLQDFNSVNHLAQLDLVKDLDREQRERRTPAARREVIRQFLRKVEVADQVEGPPVAKKLNLSKNGKPAMTLTKSWQRP